MKSFFSSKINVVAVITVVLGGLTAAQQLNLSPETQGLLTVAVGVVTMILRTFYSSPLPVNSDK
jgi:hypothetical protein